MKPPTVLSGDLDYLQAKVHGLRSKLYEGHRLDDLADLRTVPQLWHRIYPDAEPSDHHDLQRQLLADHVRTLDILRLHLPQGLTGIATWMLRRFQLENIKVLLRARKSRQPLERVQPYLARLPRDFSLPEQAILQADSLADVLLNIPVEEFRKGGQRGAALQAETGDTVFVELGLERAYYQGLLAQQARLPSRHRRAAEALVRHEAAAHTLLCLFRLKLNYDVPYERAQAFFGSDVIPPFRLERLYSYPVFDDMLDRVPREFLPREAGDELHAVADLERVLWRRLLQMANRQFYRSVDDIGAVLAFFVLKRVELANLIRVIEGVRCGLPPRAIRSGFIQ